MQIHTLTAAFGRLDHETLSLQPGLNVIERPNEGGKSTWAALLRVMLYGLNTKDRALTADKRRYLPWSGAAMEGRLEADTILGEVTITRRTARANSPMGAFSAVYTGTAQPVEDLTAASCGETLLGVSQDVFVRSAFIGQSAIEVKQNADLERRIAALITTGEEDTSYITAADCLRRQLNRRRYNKTGLLPQLEAQQESRRRELDEIQALEDTLRLDLDREQQLTLRLAELKAQLALHDAADRAQRAQTAHAAHQALLQAQSSADALAQEVRPLPPRAELEAMRGAIAALSAEKSVIDQLSQAAQDAENTLHRSEAELAEVPMTWPAALPEGAPLCASPRPRQPIALLVLAMLAGIGAGAALFMATHSLPLGLGAGAALALLLLTVILLTTKKRQKTWDQQNSALRQQRSQELAVYAQAQQQVHTAQERFHQVAAQRDAAQAQARAAAQRILTQVQLFRADAATIPAALAAVEEGIRRWATLDTARQAVQTAQVRWDAVSADGAGSPAEPVQRPLLSRIQLQEEAQRISALLADLQRQIHTAQGRIQALGDPDELRQALKDGQSRQEELQGEYDALALAQQVLAEANTALQNRFSPALGHQAEKIFAKLTGMKYNRVFLNREIVPSAQEAGQISPRDAWTLSRGTVDQLYLAVRLAICDLVLPEREAAPIILDDALVNFDDRRMAAALDYLVELGQRRQILLFTCQHRESAYLAQAHPGRAHQISP